MTAKSLVRGAPSRAAPALAAVTPVSYTHLRAHETVLDLVCRLLLEKKNTILHNMLSLLLNQQACVAHPAI